MRLHVSDLWSDRDIIFVMIRPIFFIWLLYCCPWVEINIFIRPLRPLLYKGPVWNSNHSYHRHHHHHHHLLRQASTQSRRSHISRPSRRLASPLTTRFQRAEKRYWKTITDDSRPSFMTHNQSLPIAQLNHDPYGAWPIIKFPHYVSTFSINVDPGFDRTLYKQESWAIAKMTARCALCMGALKIFGSPWLRPRLLSRNFYWAFVPIENI